MINARARAASQLRYEGTLGDFQFRRNTSVALRIFTRMARAGFLARQFTLSILRLSVNRILIFTTVFVKVPSR